MLGIKYSKIKNLQSDLLFFIFSYSFHQKFFSLCTEIFVCLTFVYERKISQKAKIDIVISFSVFHKFSFYVVYFGSFLLGHFFCCCSRRDHTLLIIWNYKQSSYSIVNVYIDQRPNQKKNFFIGNSKKFYEY